MVDSTLCQAKLLKRKWEKKKAHEKSKIYIVNDISIACTWKEMYWYSQCLLLIKSNNSKVFSANGQ